MIKFGINIPLSGTVTWNAPEPAYPEIVPNRQYDIHIANDMPCIFLHVSFWDNQELCLANGECTADMLGRAVFGT
jgi:hypothetical protein